MRMTCHPTEVGALCIMSVILPLVYYCVAKGLDVLFLKQMSAYRHMGSDKKKNMIVYVLEVLFTTLALLMGLLSAEGILVSPFVSLSDMRYLTLCGQIIISLYLFEMAFKDAMHTSLLVHHVSMIVIFFMASITFTDTHEIWILRASLALLVAALTEQTTFMGLFLYRLEHSWAPYLLQLSSLLSVLLKTVAMGLGTYAWIKVNQLFWWIAYPILAIGLLWPSQLYAAWILWALAKRFHVNRQDSTRRREATTEGSL